jgi:hypothetical protein
MFKFGSLTTDPQQNVSFSDYMPILFNNATNVSTQPSLNASTGSLLLSGGLSISNTVDASSTTCGGSFTSFRWYECS